MINESLVTYEQVINKCLISSVLLLGSIACTLSGHVLIIYKNYVHVLFIISILSNTPGYNGYRYSTKFNTLKYVCMHIS